MNARKLYEIAHCRAGDKGDTLTLSIFPYQDSDYLWLEANITAEVVKEHLKTIVLGEVTRYELPDLKALQFVCTKALSGGVTTSLAMDIHGKSISYALLNLILY